MTAGSWAPEILKNLGMRLPIQGAKGYSFTFKRPAQWPSRPFSLSEIGVAGFPDGRVSSDFRHVRHRGPGSRLESSANVFHAQGSSYVFSGPGSGESRIARSVARSAALQPGRTAFLGRSTRYRESHCGGRSRHDWSIAGSHHGQAGLADYRGRETIHRSYGSSSRALRLSTQLLGVSSGLCAFVVFVLQL